MGGCDWAGRLVRFWGHRSGHDSCVHHGRTVTECSSRPAAPVRQTAVCKVDGSPLGDPKSEL